MKNYSKTGGRKGKPAYRTPSRFQAKKHCQIKKIKAGKKKKCS